MYQTIIDYIKGLNEKELKNLYNKYCNMAFNFYVDCDKEKYDNVMFIINLIDQILREKGYWKK